MAARAFPPRPSAVAAVRAWLREQLERWAVSVRAIEDALLLTSELATNAVMHAGTPFEVTISLDPALLRIAVSDDFHRLPKLASKPPSAQGGRGLRIVQALASRWGAEPVPGDGKVVWFELAP